MTYRRINEQIRSRSIFEKAMNRMKTITQRILVKGIFINIFGYVICFPFLQILCTATASCMSKASLVRQSTSFLFCSNKLLVICGKICFTGTFTFFIIEHEQEDEKLNNLCFKLNNGMHEIIHVKNEKRFVCQYFTSITGFMIILSAIIK